MKAEDGGFTLPNINNNAQEKERQDKAAEEERQRKLEAAQFHPAKIIMAKDPIKYLKNAMDNKIEIHDRTSRTMKEFTKGKQEDSM